MFNSRPHERHDLYSSHRIRTTGFFWILLLILDTEATPIHSNAQNSFERRDNNNQFSGAKIWIPVIVVLVVLFCIALMICTKRSLRKSGRFFSFVGASVPGAPTTAAPGVARELTAEQLAGAINGENRPVNGNAPRTARRPRRPRRTPSQMSVTSLPPYNKEPGEEELVIFRGQDMEDATMPAAIVNSSADDDGASMSSQDQSQVSRYSPMPTSPHNMPLLHNDDTEGDLSLQSLASAGEDRTRPDVDPGSHETSSLHNGTADPRGEAPAYFEVVDADQRLESPEPAPAPPTTSPEPNPRRSGFRNLLNRMSGISHTTGHNRTDSSHSVMSSSMSHGHEPLVARGGSGHRASPSSSGSHLSTSMFRTLSRQRSNHTLNSNRLNSPSLISLNSISAPLTHTVTRTEYTYPKTGPTAEQLKVISSRESFARFGVPYGPDAVAFAASSSRQDLLPPPGFDSAVSETASPRSPSRAGPSRLRSTSNAAELMAQISPTESSRLPPTSPPDSTRPEHQSTVDASAAQAERSSSISKSHNYLSGPVTASETTTSSISSALPPPSSQAASAVSEFGKLSAPPSSHHDQTGWSTRSESRASLYTFQTAAESLSPATGMHSPTWHGSVSSNAGDSMYESGPSTPRLEGRHALEPTDVTITPDLVRAASLSTASINETPTPAGH